MYFADKFSNLSTEKKPKTKDKLKLIFYENVHGIVQLNNVHVWLLLNIHVTSWNFINYTTYMYVCVWQMHMCTGTCTIHVYRYNLGEFNHKSS